MENFFPLVLQEVIPETADAVTLAFLPAPNFAFQAGQYITFRLNIDGKTFRRAYSLSASPLDEKLCITVKQVQGGKVSPYLCNKIAAGASLEVLPPMGDFTFQPATEKGKSYFMFAGGSGITPIFSILKTILQTEPQSNVYLFFGNKNKKSIIFGEELAALEAKYPQRFFREYVLEEVEKIGFLQSIFAAKKEKEVWQGMADKRMTMLFLNKYRPQHRSVEYFICGPTPMMNGTEALLLERGVSPENIRLERFSTEESKTVTEDASIVATLTAHLRGEKFVVPMREGQTVLEALLQENLDPPYSCRTGSCATCIGKCNSGKVKMKANSILEEKEIKEGLVLTCQSLPLTEEVEIRY
jgi:ring-1,2-phenylacetyl-CoA epoxidase subunit PaaE